MLDTVDPNEIFFQEIRGYKEEYPLLSFEQEQEIFSSITQKELKILDILSRDEGLKEENIGLYNQLFKDRKKEIEISLDEEDDLDVLKEDLFGLRDFVFNSNIGLVIPIAKKNVGPSYPLREVINDGSVGLMRAIYKFNFSLGNRFSTYAEWWIRQPIYKHIAVNDDMIKIPFKLQDCVFKVKKEIQNRQLGSQDQIVKLIEEMFPDDVESVVKAFFFSKTDSLDSERGDENAPNYHDRIASDMSVEALVFERDNSRYIQSVAYSLFKKDPRSLFILSCRFGIGLKEIELTEQEMTLEGIASRLYITRERVRQLQNICFNILRENLNKNLDRQVEDVPEHYFDNVFLMYSYLRDMFEDNPVLHNLVLDEFGLKGNGNGKKKLKISEELIKRLKSIYLRDGLSLYDFMNSF